MLVNSPLRALRAFPAARRSIVLGSIGSRNVSTLQNSPHIFVHKHPIDTTKSILSLLPTCPVTPQLAIGTTALLPPTPGSFTPNPPFLPILSSVYATHAAHDQSVIQQAAAFASPGGSFLRSTSNASGDGSGGASHQGGAGGAGLGGWIHVSDLRNPPDFGRIAWPEDILGSVEVDGNGNVMDGTWQDSGTYRVVTREGILGVSDFMRGKLVERLMQLELEMKGKQ